MFTCLKWNFYYVCFIKIEFTPKWKMKNTFPYLVRIEVHKCIRLVQLSITLLIIERRLLRWR